MEASIRLPDEQWVGVAMAARVAGVSADSIRRWCDNGRLPCRRLGEGAHRRIQVADLLAVLDGDSGPVMPKVSHSTLAEVVEQFAAALEKLSPFEPSVADSPRRLMAALVALRGNSRAHGMGGLVGVASRLAAEVEEALDDKDRPQRSAVQERAMQGIDLDD